MKCILVSFFTLLFKIAVAQPRDLATLPFYDCSLKKVMSIAGRQTIIISPDNDKNLQSILNDYCATLGTNCIRKQESELSDIDFSKDLFIIGVLKDFKNWKKFKVPIIAADRGFEINNEKFHDSLDGFVFVDTNRIIISGNNVKAVKDAQLAFTGGHDILITQKGKITFFGNSIKGGFRWFNLQNLRTSNYTGKPSELFSAIYVSKTFEETVNYTKLNKELQSYAAEFLSIYNLQMPAKKVRWFIHSNMQEYGTMSGMFGLTCPGNNSAGFSIRGEIHTKGFNTALVKHEYSHFLFDNSIPQDNNPAFFVEGCVEYITNTNNSALYKERLAVAKKYKDTLNYTNLIINNQDFYGQYSEANYSICGILVKYILDNFGVEAFKKFCLAEDKNEATKMIFKKGFENLITDYKDWLDKQNDH